jgi:hypothetical protein
LLWIGVVAGAGPVRALAVCALAISMSAGKLAGGYREKTATNTYGLARFLEDVPCETRPAALQSGLPHWLNPCVENIDGKVNKGALSAILAGRYGEWLAQQRFGIIADSELFGYEEHPAVKSAYTPGSGPRNLIVLEATRPRVAPSNAGDGTDLSGGG